MESRPPNSSRTMARIMGLPWDQERRFAGRRVDSVDEEVLDRFRDFFGMCFQREVAGVEETDGRTGNVALEGLGTSWQEERIVLAPHRQERRLVPAEVFLESR